jgi:hypothetical protein
MLSNNSFIYCYPFFLIYTVSSSERHHGFKPLETLESYSVIVYNFIL